MSLTPDLTNYGSLIVNTLNVNEIKTSISSSNSDLVIKATNPADSSKYNLATFSGGVANPRLLFSRVGTGVGSTVTLRGVSDPVDLQDVATKNYVDNVGFVTYNLSDLTDTSITTPANGNSLQYKTSDNKWHNVSGVATKGDLLTSDGTNTVTLPLGTNGQVLVADSTQPAGIKWSSGGGGGTLAALTDVTIATPANNQGLQYQTVDSKWHNVDITLDNLNDVVTTSLATNDYLYYNGTNFVNSQSISVGDFKIVNQSTQYRILNSAGTSKFFLNDSSAGITTTTDGFNQEASFGAFQLPTGTTAERPTGLTVSGALRYNTTLDSIEWYNATTSSWIQPSLPNLSLSIPSAVWIFDPSDTSGSVTLSGSNLVSIQSIGTDTTATLTVPGGSNQCTVETTFANSGLLLRSILGTSGGRYTTSSATAWGGSDVGFTIFVVYNIVGSNTSGVRQDIYTNSFGSNSPLMTASLSETLQFSTQVVDVSGSTSSTFLSELQQTYSVGNVFVLGFVQGAYVTQTWVNGCLTRQAGHSTTYTNPNTIAEITLMNHLTNDYYANCYVGECRTYKGTLSFDQMISISNTLSVKWTGQ